MRSRHGASLVIALTALAAWSPGAAQARAGDVRLPGEVSPALARAVPVDRAADPGERTVTFVLRRSDQAGFDRFLAAVTDRRSRQFRRFLTQRQVTERFGPSASAYDTVLRFLRSAGLRVQAGSANRLTITVRARRAQLERALQVRIGDYEIGGRDFSANASAPALPPAVAARLAAVVGLSSLEQPAMPQIAAVSTPPPKLAPGTLAPICELAEKLEDATGTFSDALGGLGGIEGGAEAFDIANQAYKDVINFRCAADELNLVAAYAANPNGASSAAVRGPEEPAAGPAPAAGAAHPAATARPAATIGDGQKIGLLEYANFNRSDVSDFLTLDDFDPNEINDLSEHDVAGGAGPAPGPGESEALLDIDATLSLAPGAQVVVYDSAFSGGASFQAMFNAMINDGDTVISNSWSECEDQVSLADAQSIDEVLANAAASGITVLNGSGDSGSRCLDGSPDTIGVPADSPHATAVGGSSLTPGPLGTYGSESWWDGSTSTPVTGQGGYGVSRFFAAPAYQAAYSGSPARSIPDLVVNADPAQGYVICQADAGGCPSGLEYGGTSAAAPIVAAFVADINSELGHDVGELNPLVYPLGATSAFHPAAALGSDFAHVGLGSPNLDALYLALAGTSAAAVDPTTSSLIGEPLGNIADGSGRTVVALLLDKSGNSVAGQHVTLAAGAGSHATISAPSGPSTVDNGAVSWQVSDTVPEDVTFTATDTDTGMTLAPLTVDFASPPAAGGAIAASPSTVTADGTSTAQIEVKLQDGQGNPAVGKVVALVPQANTHSQVAGPAPLTTGANGIVDFQVSDTTAETVSYTAVDVTDGNVPVPGQASVTFSNVPQGQPQCDPGPPSPTGGYALSPFATAFTTSTLFVGFVTTGPCASDFGLAFSPAGQLYVTSQITGDIYRFGPTGGLADAATQITPTGNGPTGGLAFGPDGTLFAVQPETQGDYTKGDVVELDPATGAITATIASGLTCPDWLAVDPLSGDLFVSNGCSGFVHSDDIVRIHDPLGQSPTASDYTTSAGSGQIAFAPDGTLYQASYLSSSSHTGLLAISGTNGPATPTVTEIGSLGTIAAGIAIGATDPQGHAQYVYTVNNPSGNESVDEVDLATGQAQVVASVSGGAGVTATVGPDGCLYTTGIGEVYRLTNADGSCSLTPNPATPQLTLAPAATSPEQGGEQTVTATVRGAATDAGIPVRFVVTGANPHLAVADTDTSGQATFTYQGVAAGLDQVTANATASGTALTSNQASVDWTPGAHATAIDLGLAPTGGPVGSPTTLVAVLYDLSGSAELPIAGQPVTLSLSGQSCVAATDSSGQASCTVTPTASAGITTFDTSYKGVSGQYSPSSADDEFVLTPLQGTALAYTGVGSVAQGAGAAVAARLTVGGSAAPLAGEPVVFTLGSGAGAQGCTGTTDGTGTASCTIAAVDQPTGTQPLQARFAGDAAHAAALAPATLQVNAAPVVTLVPGQVITTSTTSTTVTANTTITTTTRTATPTGGVSANTVTTAAQPASLCGAVEVDLVDVYVQGGHVALLGYANPRLAGTAVRIVSAWNGKVVAHSTVATSGYFSAQAPEPSAALLTSDRTRYVAHAGSYTSPALKLSRRMYVFSVRAAGGNQVEISGRVVGPLASPPAAIVVTRRNSCAQRTYVTVKAKVSLNRKTGDFTATAPAPPATAPGATYVLRTKVRENTHSKQTFDTFTLPRVVGD